MLFGILITIENCNDITGFRKKPVRVISFEQVNNLTGASDINYLVYEEYIMNLFVNQSFQKNSEYPIFRENISIPSGKCEQ